MNTNLQNVSFIVSINQTKNGKTDYLISPSVSTESFSIQAHNSKTEAVKLMFDHYPDYDELKVVIRLVNKDRALPIVGTTLYWEYGNPNQPMFQILSRTVFSIVCLASFVFFSIRLCVVSFINWHLEQKLTYILLILCIISDDPFYFLQFYLSIPLIAFVSLINTSAFNAYIMFFIFTLFSSMAYKNRKTPKLFLESRIIYIVIDFFVDLLYLVITSNELPETFIPFDLTNNLERKTLLVKNTLLVIYCVLLLISIIKSMIMIDITEKYKFKVYLASSLAALLPLIVVYIFDAYEMFKDTSLGFLTTFALQNSYVLLMTLFHWPYEVILDQEYHNAEHSNEDVPDFFSNDVE